MLIIQSITLRYEKDVRYASYANQRRSVRFWLLPHERPEESDVFLHQVDLFQETDGMRCCRDKLKSLGAEAFYDEKFGSPDFFRRIAVTKEGDCYRVGYKGYGGINDMHLYSTKMIVRPDEYVRIVFNERGMHWYSGIWFYDIVTYNFLNVPYSDYRQKLFFRKEADHEYKDMKYLLYSG